MDNQRLLRQGDILLRRIDRLPRSATAAKNQEVAQIIAHGEKTGHKHVLVDGTVHEQDSRSGRKRFIEADQSSRLVHNEHAAIEIPAGIWEIVQQRTYQPRDTPRPSAPSVRAPRRARQSWRFVQD